MKSSLNKKFNPKELVKSEEYGFLGEPLDKPVKKTVIKNGNQKLEFSSINKKNLSLGPYQRPEDKQRINNKKNTARKMLLKFKRLQQVSCEEEGFFLRFAKKIHSQRHRNYSCLKKSFSKIRLLKHDLHEYILPNQ